MATFSNYSPYVGGPSYGYVQVNTGANAVEYPSPQIVDVFGPIYTPRLYAKDLTAMEIASSGGVSIAVNDVRSIDIYEQSNVAVLGAYDASCNSSHIAFNKAQHKLELFGRNGIDIGDSTSGNVTLDTAGSHALRIAGSNVLTIQTSGAVLAGDLQIQKKSIVLAANSNLIDGSSNNGAGLRVWGLASNGLTDNDARYVKSWTWNYNSNGTLDLGGVAKTNTEAYWEVRGGHFRISHYKNQTGNRQVSYVMRINDKDELELVKMTLSNTTRDTKVIARFGVSSNVV